MIGSVTLLVGLSLLGAEEPAVPAGLQAELLARVLRYDRGFANDEVERVQVLVVHAEAPASEAFGHQLLSALREQPALGGKAHDETLSPFTSVKELGEVIKRTRARVVILAPGLASQAQAIAALLADQRVLSVSSTPHGIKEGLVLGFDLVAGKPRMLFNLEQSRRQKADFRAEILKLMTVLP